MAFAGGCLMLLGVFIGFPSLLVAGLMAFFYDWDAVRVPLFAGVLLVVLNFGFQAIFFRVARRRWRCHGDKEVWPFLRAKDYRRVVQEQSGQIA
jgi:hypothetical protein